MGNNIKANLGMEINMVMAYICGKITPNFKDNIIKIIKMDLENIHLQMVVSLKDSGSFNKIRDSLLNGPKIKHHQRVIKND